MPLLIRLMGLLLGRRRAHEPRLVATVVVSGPRSNHVRVITIHRPRGARAK